MPDKPLKFRPPRAQVRSIAPKWRRWYSAARWKRMRSRQLNESPLCRECLTAGRSVPATDVDHIVPHRGCSDLFFDRHNLQSLCQSCHSIKTQRGE